MAERKPPEKAADSGRLSNGKFAKGNKPTGHRPKVAFSLANIIRDQLTVPDPKTGERPIDAILKRLIRDARNGKPQAIEQLLSRGWGKPPQPITGDENGGPVRFSVDWKSGAGRE